MPAQPDCLFLRAARGEATPRPPVWMMRQAGRYLPEYREVRQRASFLDLCRDAELACEVTLQPIRRYGFDAAIIFSDILLPLIGMGADFRFGDGGPKLAEPFDTPQRLAQLREVDAREELPWVHEALALTRSRLDGDRALLGFAGAPFTLLCYLVEGQGSRLFPNTKQMLLNEPQAAREALSLLGRQVGHYLVAQLESGADAVQMFDTWAGLLHPDDYDRWALPAVQEAISIVAPTGKPIIYYINGNPALLPSQVESGCTVVGVDWRMPLRQLREQVPASLAIQGNLDPLSLLASPEEVARRTRAMLDEMRGRPGYIANLGHGVIPQTPLESVGAFVDTVQGWS